MAWILAHRQQIGLVCLGIAFGLFLGRIGSNSPQIKAEVTANQNQQGKAETRVVYRYIKGQECPEIELVSTLTGSQGQTATAKAEIAPTGPSLAVPLGILWLERPALTLGVRADRLQGEAIYAPALEGKDQVWGAKASWDIFKFH